MCRQVIPPSPHAPHAPLAPVAATASLALAMLVAACSDGPTAPTLAARSPVRAEAVAAAAAGAEPACPAFQTRDLGLGVAEDVNDDGWVVGTRRGRAVLWTRDGGPIDLGPGDAHGINDRGTVVGETGGGIFADSRPFVWTPRAGARELPLEPFFQTGVAYAINNDGRIVGAEASRGVDFFGIAVFWRERDQIGHMASSYDLTLPLDVNARGAAAGVTIAGGVAQLPAFWPTLTSPLVELPGLTALPFGEAHGLNDAGQIVGSTAAFDAEHGNVETHAVLWARPSEVRDLGTLGGDFAQAEKINNRGQVVGYSTLPGNNGTHAFLWTRSGGMRDLGTRERAPDSKAHGINQRGEIVGESGGHAVVWSLLARCAAD